MQVPGFQPLVTSVPGHVPLQARYLLQIISRLSAVSLPPRLRQCPAKLHSRGRRDRAECSRFGSEEKVDCERAPARHRLDGAARTDAPPACSGCIAGHTWGNEDSDSTEDGKMAWCSDAASGSIGQVVAEQASKGLCWLMEQHGDAAAAYLVASVCMPALADMGGQSLSDVGGLREMDENDSARRAADPQAAEGCSGASELWAGWNDEEAAGRGGDSGSLAGTGGDDVRCCHVCATARMEWMLELMLAPLKAVAADRIWLQFMRACKFKCRQAGSGLVGLKKRRECMCVMEALLAAAARRWLWTTDPERRLNSGWAKRGQGQWAGEGASRQWDIALLWDVALQWDVAG